MRWVIRGVLVVLLVAVIAAGWDFSRFVARADKAFAASPPSDAQAVATLTGASDARIIAGVKLAQQLKLPLLISGVHIDTKPADIAKIAGVKEDQITCCVTLGRAAASTEGNGEEVADWARKYQVTRIIVVTSEYHMDRAMLELRHAMPEATFLPYAVSSMKVPPHDWYKDGAAAKRLFEEWAKYRIASLRTSEDTARRQPPLSPAPGADRAASNGRTG